MTECGKASLVEFSKLQQSVLIRVQNSEIVFVHEKCRKWYNNRKRINAVAKNNDEEERVPKAKTRKSEDSFSWATDCFMCGEEIKIRTETWHPVQTLEIRNSILKQCSERLESDNDDTWAITVKARLETVFDLVACKGKYHQKCRANFRDVSINRVGAPTDDKTMTTFENACEWLEKQSEVQSVSKFTEIIKLFSEDGSSYTNKWVKNLLEY